MNDYQKKCLNTWGGKNADIRSVLGLTGEAGEVSEVVKKYLRRDYDYTEMRERLIKELGDVLYYVAVCAHEFGIPLQQVADENIAKLSSRKERGKIQGDGDER